MGKVKGNGWVESIFSLYVHILYTYNMIIIIIIIFNYAVAVPIRVYVAGLYRCIIYIRGEPYRAG